MEAERENGEMNREDGLSSTEGGLTRCKAVSLVPLRQSPDTLLKTVDVEQHAGYGHCGIRGPSEKSPLGARAAAAAKGAGPRGASNAARDEKLVPDIYLTLPGSSDAPRPEAFTADSPLSVTS
ncbi:hypothetical protein INR49_024069 [Caranx melampygus]|nr:hypothetical protein INR49_024069 [Caranx melampygus]